MIRAAGNCCLRKNCLTGGSMAEHVLTGSADSVILIDFSVRRREGSRFQTDMYRGSLEQQYEKLSRRVPGDRRVPFEEFVRICFPAGLPKKYFISCPNFIRERETSPNGSTHFLHNLVIRPELTPAMQEILPPQQNIFRGSKNPQLSGKGL